MKPEEINNLLNDKKTSLLEAYMRIHEHYDAVYGQDTVLLMEVGSFFEVYGVDNDTEKIGKPREIADVLNLQLTRKDKRIKENSVKNPLMAGFPVATFDRYVSRLVQEKKYTIVIIRQEGVPPKVTRFVDRILSPGVNIDYCLDHQDNFIASLVVEEHQGVYGVGYAALDVSTGKTYLFEGHSTKEDKTAALDELFSLLQSHNTSELVIIPGSADVDLAFVREYLELTDSSIQHIRTKRLSVSYQNELFKKAYLVQSFLSPIEFLDLEKQPLTSESLAHLLEFVVEHDYKVIQSLKKPTLIDTTQFLYLGNNPLEQLNILSRDPRELTVLKLFDFTTTSIGKRLFKDRLTNPITNKDELEARYNLSDWLEPVHHAVAQDLKKVYDLERIARRIQLGRLHPFEINFLHESLLAANEIFNTLKHANNPNLLPDVLAEQGALTDCISHLETVFDLDQTSKVTQQTISTTLFNAGFHRELDELMTTRASLHEKLETIQQAFVKLLTEQQDKEPNDYVTIKQLEKEGHYISMTRSRYAMIENEMKDVYVSIDGTVYAIADFSYKVQKTNVKITAEIIDTLSQDIVVTQTRIVALVKNLFADALQRIDTQFSSILDLVTTSLAKIDVGVSNVKASKALRLVRPEIVDVEGEEAYLSFTELRHPLVESKEDKGIYIPNNVVLGNKKYLTDTDSENVIATQSPLDVRGALLYGINSSGKSSLMKSIGIAIVLAQAGFFVPARSMRFSLCKELFTRIVAKDNVEKGLSSFAVEMMELKNIFNRCSPQSLILGDEISHGTETLSAIAIVGATIKRLIETKSLFLFTTHLHQLNHLDVLPEQSHVACVHMCVHYNKEKDVLVFDRKLQAGSGSSIYGLEFAQSLHMDETFLQYAMKLRKELAGDYTDIELLTKKVRSNYHPEVFLTSCAVCHKPVDDVHHISAQKEADSDGNIGHIHKNHKYNLLPICKSCHAKIHAQELHIKGFMMTDKGLELTYEEPRN